MTEIHKATRTQILNDIAKRIWALELNPGSATFYVYILWKVIQDVLNQRWETQNTQWVPM